MGRPRSAFAELSGGAVDVDQTPGRRVATVLTVEPPRCSPPARNAGAAALAETTRQHRAPGGALEGTRQVQRRGLPRHGPDNGRSMQEHDDDRPPGSS
jgi:hypothetical protein